MAMQRQNLDTVDASREPPSGSGVDNELRRVIPGKLVQLDEYRCTLLANLGTVTGVPIGLRR
jgi:hypothetical protein